MLGKQPPRVKHELSTRTESSHNTDENSSERANKGLGEELCLLFSVGKSKDSRVTGMTVEPPMFICLGSFLDEMSQPKTSSLHRAKLKGTKLPHFWLNGTLSKILIKS